MKMRKMKRSMMWKVGVVCVVSVLVLLSGCKNAKLEAGERQLVKASLGGGELRRGRGKRSVASGHASAQPAYYESKFRVKLKPRGGVEKCLSYDPNDAAKGAYFTECDEHDTKQVWYQDYNAKVFSLHDGKKYCPSVFTEYNPSIFAENRQKHYLGISENTCGDNDYANMWYFVKLNEVERKTLKRDTKTAELYKLDMFNPMRGADYHVFTGYWSAYTQGYNKMRSGAPYVVHHSSKAQSIVDKRGFEPIELEFLKGKNAFEDSEYYVTFVDKQKSAFPFFVNKKTGKYVYIGKDMLLSDLIGYHFVAVKEGKKNVGIYSKIIGEDTKLNDLQFKDDEHYYEYVRTEIPGWNPGPFGRQFPRGVIPFRSRVISHKEDYRYKVCVYNRNGEAVGGGCVGTGSGVVRKSLSEKPTNYWYDTGEAKGGIEEANGAPLYYEFKSDGYKNRSYLLMDSFELDKRPLYVDANKFWQADNVLLTGDAKKGAWSVNTSYVQRGKVRSVLFALPFFTTDMIKVGTDYKIEFATEENTIEEGNYVYSNRRGRKQFGYLQLHRSLENDSTKRMNAVVSFYIRKGTTYERVNSIEIPLVAKTDKLSAMPVFLLLIDIEAKKALIALGSNDWNSYGQTDINKKTVKVLDLKKYEIDTEGLSSALYMGTHDTNKRNDRNVVSMRFYRPRVLAGLDVSLKDVPVSGVAHSRGKRAFSDACRFAVEGSWIGNKGDTLGEKVDTFLSHLGWTALDVASFGTPCMAYVGKKLSKNEDNKENSSGVHYGEAKKVDIAGVEDKNARVKTSLGKKHGEFLEKDEAAFFIVREVGKESWEEICDLDSSLDFCGGSLGTGGYDAHSKSIEFYHHVAREEKVNVSLACFSHREKVGGQEYNYLCVTNRENIRSIDVTVINRREDTILKDTASGNAIKLFVPGNQNVEDIELYVNFKIKHSGIYPKYDEYRVGAKLPSILTAANQPTMQITDLSNKVTMITHTEGNISYLPFDSHKKYSKKVTFSDKVGFIYQGKDKDDKVWFYCPPAVPGGSIYRCGASTAGIYRAFRDKILRYPATSDGITNEDAQTYQDAYYAFGPGTKYWEGSGNNDYIETRKTPRNYVDVFFENEAKISTVEFRKVTKSGKVIIVKRPIGVVKVTFDTPMVHLQRHKTKEILPASTAYVKGTKYFTFLLENQLNEINMSVSNVLLTPPLGYSKYVDYLRVGFVQTTKEIIFSLNLYNSTTKKMYSREFDQLSATKNFRNSIIQYDRKPRVYSYVDTLVEDTIGGNFYPAALPTIPFIPTMLFGAENEEGIRTKPILYNRRENKSYHLKYYLGKKVENMTIVDKPSHFPVVWITGIDSNIDGAIPYRYKKLIKYNTYLTVTVSRYGVYDFIKKDLALSGIYTKLAVLDWQHIQEVGYSKVEDIGALEKAQLLDYSFAIKDSDANSFQQLASSPFRFDNVQRNGQRVLYYKKSAQKASVKGDFASPIETDMHIETNWKEVPTSE